VSDSTTRARLTSTTRSCLPPDDVLDGYATGGQAWLHDGAGLVGRGVAASVHVPLAEAAEVAAELLAGIDVDNPIGTPGTGPVVFGAFPFDRTATGELVVPARIVGANRQGQAWVTDVTDGSAPSSVGDGTSSRDAVASAGYGGRTPARFTLDGHGSRAAWIAIVEEALRRIDAGQLEKVVLARRVTVDADADFDVAEVVDGLRRHHPSCFTFALGGFVGASPELLVRRRGPLVVSRPMAGTVSRGDTVDADRRALEGMATSAKERGEHRLVVDAVLNALGPLCEEVSASARPEVARLATMAHLATTIAGRLRDDPPPSALAVADRLHPTPAVGGWPRDVAVATIADLEAFDRGCYAGPVGWLDGRGDGDWAVALRCATVSGPRAELAAGAGIVTGSDPAAEWVETQAKLEPMLRALVRV